MASIPFAVIEGLIQCFGKCFHMKDIMEAFLISCGVTRELATKDKDQFKFIWARRLLTELNTTEDGQVVIKRIVTEVNKLRYLPDPKVNNINEGLDELKRFKILVKEHDICTKEEKRKEKNRRKIIEERDRILKQRQEKFDELKCSFMTCLQGENKQKAGYLLEKILSDLFQLSEIEYRGSFRTETQQIDGFFSFDGFGYLVEAKATKSQPNEQDILGFKGKVDTKLESTRGLYISMNGFRNEVKAKFNDRGQNIILMDGQDLYSVLEGKVDLREGLRAKIEHAAKTGEAFFPFFHLIYH